MQRLFMHPNIYHTIKRSMPYLLFSIFILYLYFIVNPSKCGLRSFFFESINCNDVTLYPNTYSTTDDISDTQELTNKAFSQRLSPNEIFDYKKHLKFISDEDIKTTRPQYSSSHCIGDNMQHDSWRGTSCFYKNLCYDVTLKEFLYFKHESDIGFKNVSLGIQDAKWPVKEYISSTRFSPKIINSSINRPHYLTDMNTLWILYLSGVPTNVGHIIWDDFLPWFTLFNMFSHLMSYELFHSKDIKSTTKIKQEQKPNQKNMQRMKSSSMRIQPLWVNRHDNPPWASCEWIKQHQGKGHSLPENTSAKCYKNYQKWLPIMLGKQSDKVLDTDTFLSKEYQYGSLQSDLVCFSYSSAGVGALNDHCLSLHGWNPLPESGKLKPESIPCIAGRGPLLYEFRRHLFRMAEINEPKPRSVQKLLVVLSINSSLRLPYNFYEVESWIKEDIEKNKHLYQMQIEIKRESLYRLPAKTQIELVSKAGIYISVAGGGAVSGIFLPKGSAAMFFSEGDGSHQGKDDWAFWENAGWIRPSWFDLSQTSNLTNFSHLREPFLNQFRHETFNCINFMDILVQSN